MENCAVHYKFLISLRITSSCTFTIHKVNMVGHSLDKQETVDECLIADNFAASLDMPEELFTTVKVNSLARVSSQ